MDCSIIIVNYNTKEITRACLQSIFRHTSEINFEVILVDNASSDGSSSEFAEYPGIKFIQTPENLGFGRANNFGAKSASGKYIFFLNSDTLLTENSVKRMVDFFDENQNRLKIGSLGCILTDSDGNFNGAGDELPNVTKEINIYKSVIPGIKFFTKAPKPLALPLEDEYFEIGYVIGADLMMERTVFERLGGFDPDYFMYYEESDLQKRMRDLGLKAWVYTGTTIIHLEDGTGKSLKKYSNKKRTIVHKSRNIYLKKNDSVNFHVYKFWDNVYLTFAKLNPAYSRQENREYFEEIKKTHL